MLDRFSTRLQNVPDEHTLHEQKLSREEQKRVVRKDASPSSEREAQKPHSASLSGSAADRALLLETLTQQELRVLRLLALGRSNQDIAQELVVSLNTVKTHVKNLYSKLHVSSRTQASTLARDLQLL